MNARRWVSAVGLLAVLAGVWWTARAASDEGQPAHPAWANVTEQTIPPADVQAMRDTALRYCNACANLQVEQALAFFTPESAPVVAALWAKIPPNPSFSSKLISLDEPALVGPTTARVRAHWLTTFKPDLPPYSMQSKVFFQIDNPGHLIDGLLRTSRDRSLTVAAVAGFPSPWETDATNMNWTRDAEGTRGVQNEVRGLSPAWPRWDPDPWKCYDNLHAWWGEQTGMFGTCAWATRDLGAWYLYLDPRFVGASDGRAVCEMHIDYEAPKRVVNRVTYRFLMDHQTIDPQAADAKYQYPWRIADICVWKVEKLPAEAAALPAIPSTAADNDAGTKQ